MIYQKSIYDIYPESEPESDLDFDSSCPSSLLNATPSSQNSMSPSKYPLVTCLPSCLRISSNVVFLSKKIFKWSLITCLLWQDGQRIKTVPLWYPCLDIR